MSLRRLLLRSTTALCLAAPAMPAQIDVLGKAAPASARSGAEASRWVSLPIHTPAASRAAFRACDRNGDDRLSVYEVNGSLDILEDLRDTRAFRQLDSNSDGFVDWLEFDQRFRHATEHGIPLRLQPLHPLRLNPAVDSAAQAERLRDEALFRSMDVDGNGALLQSEVDAFIAASPLATVKTGFKQLDADRSGTLDVDELRPVAEKLRAMQRRPPATPEAAERLPESFANADHDQDGVIDAIELADALRLQHPALIRWTRQIIADADRSANGTLGRAELLAAQNSRPNSR